MATNVIKLEEYMRLRNIYILCKQNINDLYEMGFTKVSGSQYHTDSWLKDVEVLKNIASYDYFGEYVKDIYNSMPVLVRNQMSFDIDSSTVNAFLKCKAELVHKMETIISLYEAIKPNDNEGDIGIDIMLPKFENFHDFSSHIKEIEFILYQFPFIKIDKEEIKFKNVDVGSTWLSFVVPVAVGMIILNNLAQLIDKAIIIRSKNINIKQQEEILRASGMKSELLEEVLVAYNAVLDQTLENCIQDLEGNNKLSDGEERGRAKTSLLKLSEMLDKGMQIYTAIDAPKEIQVLFPKEEKYESLGGDIIKLLESK